MGTSGRNLSRVVRERFHREGGFEKAAVQNSPLTVNYMAVLKMYIQLEKKKSAHIAAVSRNVTTYSG